MPTETEKAPSSAIQIRVEPRDFELGVEYESLRRRSSASGAIVAFTGLVRDFNAAGSLAGIILEHYPAMTIKSLYAIAEQAMAKWQLEAVTIVHRVGRLESHDQIVLVGVSARHRDAAFDGARFIMDYLKTEAPFWKKEVSEAGGEEWVDAKDSDQRARDRW
ncbi:MAG: molybdenum cofactor biosynthesis protein MoaE [Pseudomonadales bacterium]|nr:molybdenum cofactor biosynthesis protein MoaE [Pseudomonadales bacterium]